MRRSPAAARWLALVGCLTAALAWAQQSLHIVELQHRTAEEVIPILQPLLEPGAAVSGQDYRLFIRTSSANAAQLRAALAQIDRPQRRLQVSVRRATQQQIERERVSASGTLRTGEAAVSAGEAARRSSGVSIRATDESRRATAGGVSTVQVLEGASAYIATGTSTPVITVLAAGGGRRPWVAGSTAYRDVSSGFTVTPRVSGDQAVLEIAQRDDSLERGQIATQRLTTQISAQLGEWTPVGGITQSTDSQHSGLLRRSYETRSEERLLWVKVELADER